MMDWQKVLLMAERDGTASQEFLDWLRQLVARVDELEQRNNDLEERLAALEP